MIIMMALHCLSWNEEPSDESLEASYLTKNKNSSSVKETIVCEVWGEIGWEEGKIPLWDMVVTQKPDIWAYVKYFHSRRPNR